jgi:N6-adenosine-specific RNA methylase IME4/predicted transcriptional regulator
VAKRKLSTPYADLLPPLSTEELAALRASIQAEGVRHPVEIDESGNVLDGHHRLQIEPKAPTVIVRGLSPAEKEAYVLRSNSVRRNLSPEQDSEVRQRKRETANKLRTEDAKKWTQKRVAATLGVSQKTVSMWWDTSIIPSNISSKRPDARLKLPRKMRDELVARVEAGDSQTAVAADMKISQQRVSQIVTQAKKKRENKRKVNKLAKQTAGDAFDGIYDVVVIDPPWPMEKIDREVRPNQSAFDYPTMTESQIAAVNLPAAADCHLWLWTTHRFLPMAFRVLDEWKFRYVCAFVWHKPGGFQPVGLPQYNCEFALYARLGSPQFTSTKALQVCFEAKRGRHSEKPNEFYDLVRRVTSGRRIDMFSRRKIEGFDAWGNEACKAG